MSGTEPTPRPRPFESAKITDAHRAKLAVVYVRQSTPQQVAENRESIDRQYALAEHARALGWPADRVLVIDDDLGQSGTHRRGPARLPAPAGRGQPGPCRAGPGTGDEPALAVLQGLASARALSYS